MRTELEPQDIEAIAQRVADILSPHLINRPAPSEERVLDVKDLAQYLSVPASWVYERTRELPHYKVGGTLRFRVSEIDKWLSTYRVPAVKGHRG